VKLEGFLSSISNPYSASFKSLMICGLNKELTYEAVDTLNPLNIFSSVTQAPPTKYLFSRTKTFLFYFAK